MTNFKPELSMSSTSFQAAKLVCSLSNWTVTNLELHKLLYIIHMVHMGKEEIGGIIDDELFQAWMFGPVLPSLYKHCECFGARPIKNVFNHVDDLDPSSPTYHAIMNGMESLGSLAPYQLVSITHSHLSAWSKCYTGTKVTAIIDNDEIRAEYERRFKTK